MTDSLPRSFQALRWPPDMATRTPGTQPMRRRGGGRRHEHGLSVNCAYERTTAQGAAKCCRTLLQTQCAPPPWRVLYVVR